MQPNSVACPPGTLLVLAIFGICLFSFLICRKFYGNLELKPSFAAAQVVGSSARCHVAAVAAVISAALTAAGLLLPSLLRAAGATPLRALTVVVAAMLACGAGTLARLVSLLPAEAVHGFFHDGAVSLVVCLLLAFEGFLLLATRSCRGMRNRHLRWAPSAPPCSPVWADWSAGPAPSAAFLPTSSSPLTAGEAVG